MGRGGFTRFFDKPKRNGFVPLLCLVKEGRTTREGCYAVFEGKLRPSAAFCSLAIKAIIPRSQSLASRRNFLFKNLRLLAQPFCHDSRQRTQTYFRMSRTITQKRGKRASPERRTILFWWSNPKKSLRRQGQSPLRRRRGVNGQRGSHGGAAGDWQRLQLPGPLTLYTKNRRSCGNRTLRLSLPPLCRQVPAPLENRVRRGISSL